MIVFENKTLNAIGVLHYLLFPVAFSIGSLLHYRRFGAVLVFCKGHNLQFNEFHSAMLAHVRMTDDFCAANVSSLV